METKERKSLAVTGVKRERKERGKERRKERGKERESLETEAAGSERVPLAVREDSNNGRPVNTCNIVILLTQIIL